MQNSASVQNVNFKGRSYDGRHDVNTMNECVSSNNDKSKLTQSE